MTTLDFVVIGAEKSGTTLLVDRLRLSPALSLPLHEVRHFRDPFYPDRECVEDQFDPSDRRTKGIKHPSYLARPEAPARLYAHNPKLKLIALLREPSERVVSSYLHSARHGQIPLLEPNAGLAAAMADPNTQPKYNDILAFSSYADSLERYLKMFPRAQIHVADYRHFVHSPTALEAVCAFLGVPVPENAWPFPVVNRGSYDWAEVERSHAQARARNIYDDLANIIGSRPGAISAPADERPSVEVSITDETRAALRARYAHEGRRLVELGIFDHQPWQHTA